MKSADLVTKFQKHFNSRYAKGKPKNRLSLNELAILYLFGKWLDRKYKIETKKKPAK